MAAATPTRAESGSATPHCRAPADAVHAPVDIAPCIAKSADLLEISARVVSREPAEVTVHVWLWERATKDPLEPTLRTCLMMFTAAGQAKECGPHLIRPSQAGHYRTATGAQSGVAEIPRVWPQGRNGILSPVELPWPLSP